MILTKKVIDYSQQNPGIIQSRSWDELLPTDRPIITIIPRKTRGIKLKAYNI
jgi:hypothetical protein